MKLRCLSTPHKVRGLYDDKSMADQVGVSKSEVSRESIEAGTRVLKELAERNLSELDVLVVYLDGIVFGDYHVLAAVGVDADGRKHVLGLCGGASENTEVTAGLLEDLVARGLRADRRRLFVITTVPHLSAPQQHLRVWGARWRGRREQLHQWTAVEQVELKNP